MHETLHAPTPESTPDPAGPSASEPRGGWKLEDLPAPPQGRHGWPWDRAADPHPMRTPGGNAWPRVSIVTPSYNQGQFLEETIRSVLLQGYADLDYRVIDGGSTDGTRAVLEKYGPWLSEWVSEPDEGQADAIAKGFGRGDGTVMNFINSDDWFAPGAIHAAAGRLADGPGLGVVYGTAVFTDAAGAVLRPYETREFDAEALIANNFIGQPSLFHRRSVYESSGGLDTRWNFVLDYALWLKWAAAGVGFAHEPGITAYYRLHEDSKSCTLLRSNQDETLRLLEAYADDPRLGAAVRRQMPGRVHDFALWSYAQLDLAQFWRMLSRYCLTQRRPPTGALARRAGTSLLGPAVLRRLRAGVYGPSAPGETSS